MRDQLRDALRWPLYSPKRLLAVVAAVIALLVLANSCQDEHHSNTAATTVAPEGTRPSKAAPSAAASARPDSTAALKTAHTFVEAWASHNPDPGAWLKQLEPYTTDRLLTMLRSTDPSRVPATRVGDAKLTDTGGGPITSAAVSTDRGPVTIGMLWAGDRWLVGEIKPGAQAGS
ncbi:hypothetical protein [Streptomyces sp. NPDC037389]|uniref:hypothetical protein n=1 Tax=Streptomyces sp. NPDC037389 TaxID=3155369 RepID=UPI0033D5F3FB